MIVIKRTYFSDATMGLLYIEGQDNPVFPVIERPWLDNRQKISCIPEGDYDLKPYSSAKYPEVWEICAVQDRTAILIHAANWAEQLEGCIAPGLSFGYMLRDGKLQKAVMSSQQAIAQLKVLLHYPNPHKLRIIS